MIGGQRVVENAFKDLGQPIQANFDSHGTLARVAEHLVEVRNPR